eukprot:2931970-Amphidinium_carterae.1
MASDREVVLAAVSTNGRALAHASETMRADREIVLAAVSCGGESLQYAAEHLKHDREVVLRAVSQNAFALQSAPAELRRDREIVLKAISQDEVFLHYADDVLLEDETFAVAARGAHFFFKINSLSGRSCCVALHYNFCGSPYQVLLSRCCEQLGIDNDGTAELLHGTNTLSCKD